jgi:hypothetical protein
MGGRFQPVSKESTMTDATQTPTHELRLPETEPVLPHEDFAQVVLDTQRSYQAVSTLMLLLNNQSPEDLTMEDRQGLAVLLEGTLYRLELALGGLRDMGRAMKLPSVLNAGG